ncbi:hypothetical protein A8C32_01475 [Flavivirga aquatica]|uniref:STAS domain-containing protein n=1 Tax=Flavivirga aquatica TaxID=1849968 RepID=A0A1E5T9W1_9FLAO|nr:STAS domain-containing protein [Flavivirga aquatica]OEK08159.1 hypothetical protein A8C32_01475 [Flavivirga aquatica]
MALKITQQREIFLVEGTLNMLTALNFKNHVESVMEHCDDLVIDIDNVTEIDNNGMEAIRSIYEKTLESNKKFYVVGAGCKEVYDDLCVNNAV